MALRLFGIILGLCLLTTELSAQTIQVGTVSRAPFSFVQDGADTGFSIDLIEEISKDLRRPYEITRYSEFRDMLAAVNFGQVDVAIANISITSKREEIMDFSHPIFESGLQVMIPKRSTAEVSLLNALLSTELLIAIILAFALLFGGGMLMWVFERNAQPYFDRPAKDAMFPSFWWALNLVVNGGFEERVPRSPLGRVFAVFLVVSSLFIVSAFVAQITAAMTVSAINQNVTSVNDLYGRRVGTITGSTASKFMDRRDIQYAEYEDLENLLAAFEAEDIEAVLFDAPVLAFYVQTRGKDVGMLAGPVFLRENYGIALPSGSPLKEQLNQSLLKLRENGRYDQIHHQWFGDLN